MHSYGQSYRQRLELEKGRQLSYLEQFKIEDELNG